VRLAFLDESGRSRHEPIIVVAGIIVHGDRVYRKLEQRLTEIVVKHIPREDWPGFPREDWPGFVFHAKDIFQGAGYFKDKGKWPRERRFPILHDIAKLPTEFWMPVVFGHVNKDEYRKDAAQQIMMHSNENNRAHVIDVAEHMVAAARAEIGIERRMRLFPRDEICMLIAEDTDRVKRAVKGAHALLRNPLEIVGTEFARVPELPLTKIVDTPHFAEKADSAPLQVADVCAYLVLRRILRRTDSQEFFEVIAPQLSWTATDFGAPMGTERFGTGSLV
jgi:hypothetical protein